MLNKIIHFSLQNRLLILVASVLLLIGGTYTAYHTEVDVFPDLNAPTVVVMTEANGMAAEEVEQLVTFPIETAVNGATNVRRVRSSSTTGFSVVWVEFDWDTDIYLARQIVSEKLAAASEGLPENVGKPTLGPQSSILGELLIVGLTADSTSMLDLRTLADWTIRPRLLSTGGVAQVAVLGGDIKEYQVRLHPDRMKHYGVTLGEVMAVTRGMNQNTNGGVIYEYGNEYIVRGVVSTSDVDRMARSVVKTVGGVPVMLEDVAEVKVGSQQPKLGVASEKGKPAVLITVTKQPNTGTIELTAQLEAALKDLQKNLPKDVKISTDTPVALHRKLHQQRERFALRRCHLCGNSPFPLSCQYTYDDYFAHYPSAVAGGGDSRTPLHGHEYQYHELGRYGDSHRIAGRRCHRRRGKCMETLARKPDATRVRTQAGARCGVQRLTRGPYADIELYADYYRQFRAPVLFERYGRTYAGSAGCSLYRFAVRFNCSGIDAYSRVVQLSVGWKS